MAEVGEECEFCGDEIDETTQCDDCGVFYHTECCPGLCPWCDEWNNYVEETIDYYGF